MHGQNHFDCDGQRDGSKETFIRRMSEDNNGGELPSNDVPGECVFDSDFSSSFEGLMSSRRRLQDSNNLLFTVDHR